MSDEVISKREILGLIVRVTALTTVSYITLKWLMASLDPLKDPQKERKAKTLMKNLGIDKDNIKLTQHELILASNLVEPESMSHKWKDIAGLDTVVQELKDSVILPIQKRYVIRLPQKCPVFSHTTYIGNNLSNFNFLFIGNFMRDPS